MTLELNFFKGRGYETYNNKGNRKKPREEAKSDEEETAEEEQEAPVPLVTHMNNILSSFFLNVEVYINNQQIHNSNG